MSSDEYAFLATVCDEANGHANVPVGTVANLGLKAGLTFHEATRAAWALQYGAYIAIAIDANERVQLTGPGAVWCRLPRTG